MDTCINYFTAITTYEIPSGHSNYGPPLRPTTLSSSTHGYLPPSGGGVSSTSLAGGGTYSIYGGHSAHAAFEPPSHNYLPSGYGLDGAYIHTYISIIKKIPNHILEKCAKRKVLYHIISNIFQLTYALKELII